MNRSPLRLGFLQIALALAFAWFALSPQARAVCQEGCLAGQNTVLGDDALFHLNDGVGNTAVGFNALFRDTSGSANTASGNQALHNNTTGGANTATGNTALSSNTTGFENTATGIDALFSNTIGSFNTATGGDALEVNSAGAANTATGTAALSKNTTGNNNTADGNSALSNNTTGSFNIAVGNISGSNLTTGDNNIDIGNLGVAGESGVIRIGTAGTQTATFIAGIRDTPLAHGTAVAVGITADGQLGVRASSVRFKELVKPMDKASEAIFSLQPVTFRYKNDPAAPPQFGLVAEEVAKVNPDLVARDVEGKPFTVRYDEINAMLLNEFLKEHAKVEQLKKDFESKIAEQQKQLETLTAGLQKVSAQVEMSQTAPQVVNNNQ
jgi:hypothetical protein